MRGRLVLVLVRLLGFGGCRRSLRTALESGLLGRDQRGCVDRPLGCPGAGGLPSLNLRATFLLALVLRPYRVEFHFDHPRGDREIVTLGEFVKEHSLDALARDRIIVALHPLADLLAQLCEGVEPDRLGERIVDRCRQALPHLLYLDLEYRVLAGQIGGAVIGRECHPDSAVLARFGAEQLVLKARDEPSRAELDRNVLALAAGKLDVTELAVKVDGNYVAVFRRPLDRFRFALCFGDPLDSTVDVLLGDVGD